MSRVLASITGKAEHEVSKIIGVLEDKYGYPSHDVRLLAENIQAGRQKHQELGLDPDDTTPEELYHATLVRYDADCKALDARLSLDSSATAEQRFQKATKFVEDHFEGQEVWALKRATAKDLLRAYPPKRLMKQLGYRSLESMLKREDVISVFMQAKLVESDSWQNQIAKLIAKQKTISFERRTPYIAALKGSADPGDSGLVLYDQALGSVGLVMDSKIMPALSICLCALDGLQKLGIKISLANLGSELSFWSDTQNLLVWKDPQVVSLNAHDMALNHQQANSFEDRLQDKGAHNLWHELMNRYGQGMQGLEDAGQDLADSLKQTVNLPEPMTVEYEFAEEEA